MGSSIDINIKKFDSLSSTQDEAKRISVFSPEWTVVVSKIQESGKGKPGNKWFSPEGGLYFSIILKPKKDINDLLLVTKLSADAVLSFLEEYGIKAQIKLPNDVYVDDKKICGILTEKTKGSLVIGIGININIRSFPSELNATSLLLLTGKDNDLDQCLTVFLDLFKDQYLKFIRNTV